MINISKFIKEHIIVYKLQSDEKPDEWNQLIFNKDKVEIFKAHKHTMSRIIVKVWDFNVFLKNEKDDLKTGILTTISSYDIVNIEDSVLLIPIFTYDELIGKYMNDIVNNYIHSYYYKCACIIQSYFRRWVKMKKYSKQRLRLFNELLLLPPKYIIESFPGGMLYHMAYINFTLGQMNYLTLK